MFVIVQGLLSADYVTQGYGEGVVTGAPGLPFYKGTIKRKRGKKAEATPEEEEGDGGDQRRRTEALAVGLMEAW